MVRLRADYSAGVDKKSTCVLLADRHHGLRDGVRGLLETEFETVFMVADETSLLEGAERLGPAVVVIDLSLAAGSQNTLPPSLRKNRVLNRRFE